MIRGKVVRLPGGIVARWPDEPGSDIERAAVGRARRLDALPRARAAALLAPNNGRPRRSS